MNLDIEDNSVAVSADYSIAITHPLVTRTTTLHFHRTETADIKKVNWE